LNFRYNYKVSNLFLILMIFRIYRYKFLKKNESSYPLEKIYVDLDYKDSQELKFFNPLDLQNKYKFMKIFY